MSTLTTLRLGPTDHGRTLSLEEFREAEEEEGYRYELARGVLEVTEVPDDPHRQVLWNLNQAVSSYGQLHPGVLLNCGGGADFRLWLPGMASGRNPDFGVVLRGAPKNRRGRRIPALVAEIVSRKSEERDYVTKRQEYLLFGVLEYWIVDPMKGRVTVLARNGDVWDERVLEGEQTIESVLLPGFTLKVTELWVDLAEEGPDTEDAAKED